MKFLAPTSREPGPYGHAKGAARVLVWACAATIATAAFPWAFISVASLWGSYPAPIAARTEVGFTCVTTCLLTILLVLSEGRSQQAREAVRTGCMLMTGMAGAALAWRLLHGPGHLRGVTLSHSRWFFAAIATVALALVASHRRLRRPRRGAA